MNRPSNTAFRLHAGLLGAGLLGAGLLAAGLFGLSACTATGVVVGAGATAGVVAAQERGVSEAVSDTQIRLAINRLLLTDRADIYLDVHLQVLEGRVLLSGRVPDAPARVDAVRLAWQADGVREVINEMEIEDRESLTDYARDRWIEARLRGKLLADREVGSLNFSIEAVNRSLYLMGIAQSPAERDRVVGHAKNVAYVRRVVSYIILKDDPERPS